MSFGWPLVPLGELLRERQAVPNPQDLDHGNIRLISKIGFRSGRIELRNDVETRTGMILVFPGDLVVSGINAAKGAIAIYSTDETAPAAATIHYAAYTVNEDRADRRFLWWLLRSRTFQDLLYQHVPGGIKTELRAKRLLPVPVPTPPLVEQRRIVAKIDRIVAKVEETEETRTTSDNEVVALMGSALNQLSQLFPQRVGLGEALIGRPRNGWSARCDNAPDGVPVLSLSAVTGFEYRGTEYKRTSLQTDRNAHYWLHPGDILITRSNSPELVGHAAVYSGTPSPCIYPDLMMRISVDARQADTRFVWYWLQTPLAREFIYANAKGTSPTMKKISQDVICNLPFPEFVPLDEQRRIVAYLDGLRGKLDRLKALQAETRTELDALLPSILDRAFKGEL